MITSGRNGLAMRKKSVANEGGAEQSSAISTPLPFILKGRHYIVLQKKCNQDVVVARCNWCCPKREIKEKWSNISTFAAHLEAQHPAEFSKYKDEVERAQQRGDLWSQEKFQKDVAKFVIDAVIPVQSIENLYFRRIFQNLGMTDDIKNINRLTVGRRIDRLYVETIEKIKSDLSTVPFVCTTMDTWASQHRNFIGVTAHWITDNYERKSATLACRRFRGILSAEQIKSLLCSICSQFDLNSEKIVVNFTKNASNIEQAFHAFGIQQQRRLPIEENEIVNGEAEEAEETAPEEGEAEEEEVEEEEEPDDHDVAEISNGKEGMDIAASVPCAVHMLNLCITKDLMRALKRNISDKQLLKRHTEVMEKCNVLWKAYNGPKSCEIFKNITGQNLKIPEDTRWNSLYDSLKQIIQLKPKLVEICKAFQIKNILRKNDILYIEEHLKCTAPIAKAIDFLQEEKNNFYGALVPWLLNLRMQLRNLAEDEWKFCASVNTSLLENLQKRFEHIFAFRSKESKFAVIAALSNPTFKNRLFRFVNDARQNSLMNILKTAVEHEMKKDNLHIAPQVVPSTSSGEFFDFCESTETKESTDYSSKAALEILQFIQDSETDLQVLKRYPYLDKIFRKYNTPVLYAATAERLFSYADMADSPKRSRNSANLFEKRVVLKGNMHYMGR